MIEMTLENIFDLFKRKDPKKVDDAPKRIKIIEKPRTKSKDFSNIKYFDFFWRFSKSVPHIKDKYPGINGSTQGDKKLTIPAIKGLTLIWPPWWTHTHKGQIAEEHEKMIVTGWYSHENILRNILENDSI